MKPSLNEAKNGEHLQKAQCQVDSKRKSEKSDTSNGVTFWDVADRLYLLVLIIIICGLPLALKHYNESNFKEVIEIVGICACFVLLITFLGGFYSTLVVEMEAVDLPDDAELKIVDKACEKPKILLIIFGMLSLACFIGLFMNMKYLGKQMKTISLLATFFSFVSTCWILHLVAISQKIIKMCRWGKIEKRRKMEKQATKTELVKKYSPVIAIITVLCSILHNFSMTQVLYSIFTNSINVQKWQNWGNMWCLGSNIIEKLRTTRASEDRTENLTSLVEEPVANVV